jgi:hypothetical protein
MYNKELFDFVCKGNLEKSLYTTCIFLIQNSKIEILEETLIEISSYIGSLISIYEIAKLNDIIISTRNLIEDENINVSNYLILITKMCILCNIYNKNPVIKTGTIPITKLREKIIDVFSEDVKLSSNGLYKFEMIIPPIESEAYLLTIKIISSFIRIIKILDDINCDNADKINLISIKFKNCFDYIIRKKYVIQTKLNPNEYDPIYFLWGFVEILYQHEIFVRTYYWLFSYNYKKSLKSHRIGLIYACAISIIYSHKKGIAFDWNQNELNVIYKTKEIANDLLKQVRKEIVVKNIDIVEDEEKTKKKKEIDGIDYINNYVPRFQKKNNLTDIVPIPIFEEEYRVVYDK